MMIGLMLRLFIVVVCGLMLRGLFAEGTYEPVILSLVAEQGDSNSVNQMMSPIGSGVMEIKGEKDFNRLFLISRIQKRPMVICFLSSQASKETSEEGQSLGMKSSFSEIVTEGKFSNLLYALVDISANSETAKVFDRFLVLTKMKKDEVQLPLTGFLVGDRLLLPMNSGAMTVDGLRAFIASKIVRQ